MDISTPLKSDVLRPLLTWLVPGAVLVVPYILFLNPNYEGIDTFAKNYPALFTVLGFFVAIAAGVILESLGVAIEVYIWDNLLEKESGWQQSVWVEYLCLTLEREPIAQRYLRTVVMRMKFELSFSLALIASWFGWILLDDTLELLSANGQLLFSAIILTLAGCLMWTSGRSAWTLSQLRSLMVTGIEPPDILVENEPGEASEQFDRSIRTVVRLSLGGSIIALSIAAYLSGGFQAGNGFSSALLWCVCGIVLALNGSQRWEGRRRRTAWRMSLLFALCFLFVAVRLLTTTVSVINLIGAIAFAVGAVSYYGMSRRLVGGDLTPYYVARRNVQEEARIARLG